ncbi:MAG: hypothetical protein K2P87_06005, partial [Lachnospiraceae bacterium]|nr:hypothetical protein [Lachnospiraceae bacterium]
MLRLGGSNFRLGGIAPITRAVPSFEFLCALPFRLCGREEIDFPYKVENYIHFLYPLPRLSDFLFPALHFLFRFGGALLMLVGKHPKPFEQRFTLAAPLQSLRIFEKIPSPFAGQFAI